MLRTWSRHRFPNKRLVYHKIGFAKGIDEIAIGELKKHYLA
jgi:hypothetical protein